MVTLVLKREVPSMLLWKQGCNTILLEDLILSDMSSTKSEGLIIPFVVIILCQ